MIRKIAARGRGIGLAVLMLASTATAAFAQGLDAQGRQRMYYQVKPAVVSVWATAEASIDITGPLEATIEGLRLPDPNMLRDMETGIASTGSGFIITPDGYSVTSGHVVQLFQDENEDQLSEELLYEALEDVGFFDEQAEGGAALSENRKIELVQQLMRFADMTISRDLWVYTQNWQRYPAEIREYSPPIFPFVGKASAPGVSLTSGRDVAVLKIAGRDLPTVSIGDSDAMRIGENVYLAGYPGITSSIQYGDLSPATEMEASFTTGTVSSVKMDVQGSTVIQYDAATSAGSSGGPLINDRGEVIGIATSGSDAGFNFAVPTSVITQFVRSAGVQPEHGMFHRDWSNALDLYYERRYDEAIPAFDQALRVMPNLRDALELRRDAMANRGTGAAPTPPAGETGTETGTQLQPVGDGGGNNTMLFLIGGAVLVGLMLLGWGFSMRQKAAAGGAVIAEAIPAQPAPQAAIPASGGGNGRLVIQAGPLQGNRFPLPAGGLKIGRDPATCQIVISEGTVSREHAIVVPDGGSGIVIKNLSGTNPTYVNDRAIQEATLSAGDRIKIGNSVLHYEQG